MRTRGWPVVRSIAALEAYMARLKRAIHCGQLSEVQTTELGDKINFLRRAIGEQLGIRLIDIDVVMDREPNKLVCSRCKNRVAKQGYAYCKRCLDWNQERYNKRIGGAQNLRYNVKRKLRMANAA